MNNSFGQFLRDLREQLNVNDKNYSLRKVAVRLEIEPSYLSKIERGLENPSEELIQRIAGEFNLDSNVLLAMTGKVSQELQNIILQHPQIFAQLLHSLKDSPEGAILRLVREVRDGNW